jgi:hypothetical protein
MRMFKHSRKSFDTKTVIAIITLLEGASYCAPGWIEIEMHI